MDDRQIQRAAWLITIASEMRQAAAALGDGDPVGRYFEQQAEELLDAAETWAGAAQHVAGPCSPPRPLRVLK